jgi:hypothetical protein
MVTYLLSFLRGQFIIASTVHRSLYLNCTCCYTLAVLEAPPCYIHCHHHPDLTEALRQTSSLSIFRSTPNQEPVVYQRDVYRISAKYRSSPDNKDLHRSTMDTLLVDMVLAG